MEKPNIIRKSVLTLTIVTLSFAAFSQNWLDVGVKGGYGISMLYNKNIFDDPSYNHKLSGAYAFGGKIGINFGEFHEVTFDVMSSSFRQNFTFNITDTTDGSSPEYASNITYKALDLMLLYRNNNNGGYVEIGPSVSLIKSATHSDDFMRFSEADAIDNWNKTNYGVVFGFGAYMFGTENFGITMGARFNYIVSDAISQIGQSNNFPTNKSYETYTASHPFSAMFIMEFNYDLGYLAKANCSKRRKIVLF